MKCDFCYNVATHGYSEHGLNFPTRHYCEIHRLQGERLNGVDAARKLRAELEEAAKKERAKEAAAELLEA